MGNTNQRKRLTTIESASYLLVAGSAFIFLIVTILFGFAGYRLADTAGLMLIVEGFLLGFQLPSEYRLGTWLVFANLATIIYTLTTILLANLASVASSFSPYASVVFLIDAYAFTFLVALYAYSLARSRLRAQGSDKRETASVSPDPNAGIAEKLAHFRDVMKKFTETIPIDQVDRGLLRGAELAHITSAEMELTYALTERQHQDARSLEESSNKLESLTRRLNWLTVGLIIVAVLTFLASFADLLVRLGIIHV